MVRSFKILVILATVVGVALGMLWFYEPQLEPEVAAWIEQSPVPAHNPEATRLAYELTQIVNAQQTSSHPCQGEQYWGRRCITEATAGAVALDPELRSRYRAALVVQPNWPESPSKLPSWQGFITAQYLDFYRDLWQTGRIQEDTALFNLRESKRLVREALTLLDFMIAVALYGNSVSAANLTLATTESPSGDLLIAQLKSVPISHHQLENLFQKETFYVTQALESSAHSYAKKAWQVEAIADLYQQHLEVYALSEEAYWQVDFQPKPRTLFARVVSHLGDPWETQFGFNMLGYFDVARLIQQQALIARALASIYSGASPTDHGIAAPDAWLWQWRAETGELCLELEQTGPRQPQSDDSICMPHLRYQPPA